MVPSSRHLDAVVVLGSPVPLDVGPAAIDHSWLRSGASHLVIYKFKSFASAVYHAHASLTSSLLTSIPLPPLCRRHPLHQRSHARLSFASRPRNEPSELGRLSQRCRIWSPARSTTGRLPMSTMGHFRAGRSSMDHMPLDRRQTTL